MRRLQPGDAGSGRVIKLAPGIELRCDGAASQAMLLASSPGKVHLNQHALDILELCDGSRSRDRIVIDAMLRSLGSMRAADVVEFLEAAGVSGWIVECECGAPPPRQGDS